MKKRPLFLISLLVLVVFAYTAFWFYEARHVQKEMKEAFPELTYSDMSLGGYPLSINLTLAKPRLDFPVVNMTLSNDGEIRASYNLLGELQSIEKQGLTHVVVSMPVIGGTEEWQIASDARLDFSTLRLPQDGLRLSANDINVAKVVDGKTGEIGRADNLTLQVKREVPAHDRQQIYVDFSLKGFEPKPSVEGTKLKENIAFWQSVLSLLYQREGKVDYAFAFKLDLPSKEILNDIINMPLTLLKEPIPTVSLDISKIAAKDNFTSSSGSFTFALGEDAHNVVKFEISGNNSWVYSSTLFDAFNALLDKVNHEASSIKTNGQEKSLPEAIVKHVNEFKALIPRFHEFGTCKNKIALSFAVNKMALSRAIRLDDLEVACDLYGVKLHGEAAFIGATPSATGAIEVHNFRKLLADMAGYYNRGYVVYNLVKSAEDPTLNPISSTLQDKIVAFYEKISSPTADKADLLLNLGYEGNQLKVGNVSSGEFNTQWSALWNEILQEVAPSLVPKPAPPQAK